MKNSLLNLRRLAFTTLALALLPHLGLAHSAKLASAKKAPPVATTVGYLAGCFKVSYRFVEDGVHDTDIHGEFYEYIAPKPSAVGQYFQHYGVENNQAQQHWGETWAELPDGNWEQTVVSPFGDFRYSCKAPFVFNQWRCTVYNAPKPLRDIDRTDYATLDRDITMQITPNGFIQAANDIKRDEAGVAVANEVGWNEYDRVDDSLCSSAAELSSHSK